MTVGFSEKALRVYKLQLNRNIYFWALIGTVLGKKRCIFYVLHNSMTNYHNNLESVK